MFALSLLLQPTCVFLSSFLVSRSPGKGSYGSPHLLNTLLVLLPLHDWCCQPTLSLLHSFSLSAGSLTQGWIDVACGCYFSRPADNWLAPISATCDVKINCCSLLQHWLGRNPKILIPCICIKASLSIRAISSYPSRKLSGRLLWSVIFVTALGSRSEPFVS